MNLKYSYSYLLNKKIKYIKKNNGPYQRYGPGITYYFVIYNAHSNDLSILYSDWFKKWASVCVQRQRFSGYKV